MPVIFSTTDTDFERRFAALLAAKREALVWRRTVRIASADAYWTYLRHYPGGPHAGEARWRLSAGARFESATLVGEWNAGAALLPVPFVGTVGLEGSAERPWRVTDTSANRVALGLTLRDLNIPLSKVDAFATLGGQALLPSNGGGNVYALYGEAGLRGPVFGPAGWRAFVRGTSAGTVGAGLGLELRF